jgi:hypothetical protein
MTRQVNEGLLVRYQSSDGTELVGRYRIDGGTIVVTADGRQLRTQLGSTPPKAMAELLIRELVRLRPR